jgi:pimeloyl-ACP methyl ester carboxylesterase
LTFDLSGHGESGDLPASFTPREHLTDSLSAFDALAGMETVDPLRIGLCGASYGAYLAAMAISRRATTAVLLRAPALHPDSALDIPGGFRHTHPEMPGEAEPLRDLANFDGEALIVESEYDEVIPHEVIRAYLAACPKARHALIPGAAHAMTEANWNDFFVELLVKWGGVL